MLRLNCSNLLSENNSTELCKFDKKINVIYSDFGDIFTNPNLSICASELINGITYVKINEIYESSGYIYLNEIIHTDIIQRHIDPNKYKIFKIPLAFYTNCIWSVNFYHFLFEEIPIMLKFQNIDPTIPIICNYNDTYCREFIELFKIKNPIIPRTENVIYKCDKIIHYNSVFGFTPPSHIKAVRDYLIENNIISIEPITSNEKIGIIVKRNEWERQILNHNDFLNELNKSFPNYKWVEFEGNIGLKKSIELFNSASVVISPQCSATVNMIFARPNTKFFKIIGPPFNLTGMYMLEKVGIDAYMIASNFSHEENGRHFRLDLSKILPVLRKYIV